MSLAVATSAVAVEIGDIIMSPRDEAVSFGGFPNIRDEDVMALDGSSANPIVSGIWSLMFDGSANGVFTGTGFNGLDYLYSDEPDPGVPDLFFSLFKPHAIQGNYYDVHDIVAYDEETGTYSEFFDGLSHGLTLNDIDAFSIFGSSIIISIRGSEDALPGLPHINGRDLVAFTPDVDGDWNGPGTWSMFLDGSDIGLDRAVEDIDGVEVLTYAEAIAFGLDVEGLDVDEEMPVVLFSTESLSGDLNIASGGLIFQDEDIVAFFPTSLGWDTAGTGVLYLDGSAVGLASSLDAETNAFAIVSDAGGAVPEPATVALFAVGSLVLGGFGYRRRRRMGN
jgi:hypothetical protein